MKVFVSAWVVVVPMFNSVMSCGDGGLVVLFVLVTRAVVTWSVGGHISVRDQGCRVESNDSHIAKQKYF